MTPFNPNWLQEQAQAKVATMLRGGGATLGADGVWRLPEVPRPDTDISLLMTAPGVPVQSAQSMVPVAASAPVDLTSPLALAPFNEYDDQGTTSGDTGEGEGEAGGDARRKTRKIGWDENLVRRPVRKVKAKARKKAPVKARHKAKRKK